MGDIGGQTRRIPGVTRPRHLVVLVAAGEPQAQPAAFATVAAALEAAVEWHGREPQERIAVHAGPASQARRRVERLRAIANPGQIVVSASVVSAPTETAVPAGHELHDAGIHRLRDLSLPERVFLLRPTGDAAEPPRLRSVDAHPNNLPVQLTSFVGRDADVATVRSMLARERLVTLAGTGGSGKTRLAAHVAAADIERWTDGVWWVELQSLTEAAAVPAQVANAVGALVEPVGGPLRSLTGHLRHSRALLCLDNCEHVVDAVADLVRALLTSCPEVSVLTTSREPLNVAGEATWRLPTMRDDEALELFVERARQANPSFTLDDDDDDDDNNNSDSSDGADRLVLQRLCQGLDGIPLAIELAAAWTRLLSPRQIEAGLGDRFSLLVRGSRDAATRHKTLEASIDWSHDLLADQERTLLRRLAVFAGGFGLDSARAVCAGDDLDGAEVLPALDSLVDKSLVVIDEVHQADAGSGEHRFRLLETIRQYAERRLDASGELATLRHRHLDHLLAVAEQAEPLLDHDKDTWRALVEPEWENLGTALEWGLSADDPQRGRRLAAATAWLWNLRGRGPEGLALLRRAMERDPGARTLLQARLMLGFALVGDTAAPGDLDPVRDGDALARELGDDRLHVRFLVLAAVGTFYNDNGLDSAWRLCDEAVALADATGDEHGRDLALALQGLILHLRDRHDAAQTLLAPVAQRLVDRGDRGIASTLLVFQSGSSFLTGDVATAWWLAEQAAKIAEPLADYHRVGTTRSHLALLHGLGGDVDEGLRMLHRLLQVVADAGPDTVVPGMARALGLLHLWRGDVEESERWLAPHVHPGQAGRGAASGPRDGSRPLDPLALAPRGEALRRLGRTSEAEAVLGHAEALAGRLGMRRVLADAIEQRAHLAAPDDAARAFDLHHDALQLRVDHELRIDQVASLEALATLMARTGRATDAARLLAAAGAARESLGVPRRPSDEADHSATREALRAALPDDERAAAEQEGRHLTLDDAVALVRRTRGPRGRPSTGWASLTPTEMEVVRLVADGLGNPEIAAKLFMSRNTVKTHLSHVFAKLAVANRTELAAMATQRLAER